MKMISSSSPPSCSNELALGAPFEHTQINLFHTALAGTKIRGHNGEYAERVWKELGYGKADRQKEVKEVAKRVAV
jgi:hypothetical protein